ncbi:MAG: hypothetical protein ACKVLD_00910 [Flavobacteriales bacterium]|jgi:hypothetical protein|tara:strand:- start:2616 stop:3227 length:612 start_codon:yes stop_codon:yes gene_type:complete
MKNILLLLLSLAIISMVFSSCEKELLGCTDASAINFNNLANTDDGSCEMPILGCIDVTAFNFNSNANSDDGSCTYSFDLAQGTWGLDPNCEDISIAGLTTISLNDQLPETVDINSDGESSLFIDLNGTLVSGTISSTGLMTVYPSTIQFSEPTTGQEINVDVTGSGYLISDTEAYLDLNFSGSINIVITSIDFSSDCAMILTK